MWMLMSALLCAQDDARPPRVYLGVTFADEETLEIGSVVESAPAGKAGLREGDRITSFAGKAVSTFDELISEMRRCKPGDKVVLKLEREGKTIEATVELVERAGARDEDEGPRPGIEEPPAKPPPRLSEKTLIAFEAPLQDVAFSDRWEVAGGILTRHGSMLPESVLSVALWEKFSMRNGSVGVKLQVTQGEIDQAAGIVFRAIDARTYYVARVNALEGNVKLYVVRRGIRRQIKSADVTVSPGTWYGLRVDMQGSDLRVTFDGKQVLQVQDDSIAEGKIGLWSKADSTAQFDDLIVDPAK